MGGDVIVARGFDNCTAGAVHRAGDCKSLLRRVAEYVAQHFDNIRIAVVIVVHQHQVILRLQADGCARKLGGFGERI